MVVLRYRKLGVKIVFFHCARRLQLKSKPFGSAPQNAPPRPSICQLIEEVLPDIVYEVNKPVIKKAAFVSKMQTVIRRHSRLSEKYSMRTINASLSREVLDRALNYLTQLGKVIMVNM